MQDNEKDKRDVERLNNTIEQWEDFNYNSLLLFPLINLNYTLKFYESLIKGFSNESNSYN